MLLYEEGGERTSSVVPRQSSSSSSNEKDVPTLDAQVGAWALKLGDGVSGVDGGLGKVSRSEAVASPEIGRASCRERVS